MSSTPKMPPAQAIHPALWTGNQLASSNGLRIPSGFPELDQQLPGGGWPSNTLVEILLKHQGIGELRFLMPVLRRLSREGRQLVLLSPPHLPLLPTFEQFGIQGQHITLIQTPNPHDRLWAVEQVLRSDSFGALLVWLPEERQLLGNVVLRRLHYQAQRSRGLSVLFRPVRAQTQPSPAPLRLCLTALSPNSLRVHLIKRRGPVLETPLDIALPTPASALPGLMFEDDLKAAMAPRRQELDDALDRGETAQPHTHNHSAGQHPLF
ncbi:MAG: translesion DNA synthesis-associated protein ImuA [Limnobacter sp.]|uniref:translesion DNA synthesis-associated protein ImuA n=1 Tax=Limnobacter sp. TaxID=2003368 RepID=UPI0039197706